MKTDIEQIKDLLFGNEKKALDAITRRLEKRESRAADVADVLPDSIAHSHKVTKQLVPALQEPVEECIRASIRRDPEDIADALFPVMGPAIRRSIAEALRSMVQSLNDGIENSLSPATRYKAWRAGVPLGQYILQRNILYRVEQAYLIKRDDGLLIEHVQRDDIDAKDSDAVSAMFTAIQDFIHDSFSNEGAEPLTTAVMGDLTLWAVHGPHTSLVCVVRGVAHPELRDELKEILEGLNLRHADALTRFDGAKAIPGVEDEVRKTLLLEKRRDTADSDGGGKLPLPVILLALGLVAAAGWFWLVRHNDAQRIEEFRQALDATPGIVVSNIGRKDGILEVRGLRDPLSSSPADIAPGFLIDPTELRLDLAPYQSLDAAIVERRARRVLKPPPGVGLNLEGTRLRLTGSAPYEWKNQVQTLALGVPGIESVDTTRMAMSDAEVLAGVMAQLQPPDSVVLEVRDGTLLASGMAPQSWLLEATRRLPGISGVRSGDLLGVAVEEREHLAGLLRDVEGSAVYFLEGNILLAGQDVVLDGLTARIRQISNLAARLGAVPQIRVRGYADGTGTAELNRVVGMNRADRVAQWLLDAGISPAFIETQSAVNTATGGDVDPTLRKAVISIGVIESP